MEIAVRRLVAEVDKFPLIDPHSHIDPLAPTAKSLDDILGYHYYTELAHSAGMPGRPLAAGRVAARTRAGDRRPHGPLRQHGPVRLVPGDRARTSSASRANASPPRTPTRSSTPPGARFGPAGLGEAGLATRRKLEKIFLTNEFDDPLEGFDTTRYVPCLRTDDLVFHLDKPDVRERLAKATGIEVGDAARSAARRSASCSSTSRAQGATGLRHLAAARLRAEPGRRRRADHALSRDLSTGTPMPTTAPCASGVFWMLAEYCREFKLPFDLMIGVNRARLPRRRLPGAGPVRQRDVADPVRRAVQRLPAT